MRLEHRFIARIQVAGAVLGAIALESATVLVSHTVDQNIFLSWAFMAFATGAGIMLWRGSKVGVPLSLLVWLLQGIAVVNEGTGIHFLSGLGIGIRFKPGFLGAFLEFGGLGYASLSEAGRMIPQGGTVSTVFGLTWRAPASSAIYQVNFIALAFAIVLFRAWLRQDDAERAVTNPEPQG